MKSPAFNFRVPPSSRAHSWIKEKEEAGVNVSRAVRVLIETHGDLYDKLVATERQLKAMTIQRNHLRDQDSPDFRGHLRAEEDKLARIRKAERDQSTNDS